MRCISMGQPDSEAITISFVTTCPKNANKAVRFDCDAKPSWPRINNLLSLLGDGRFTPANEYTPSEYADGAFLVKWLSVNGMERKSLL